MTVTTDLLELQQVDLQIMRDRKAIDEIPQAEQIKEVRGRLKELSKKTTKIVGLLKDARIEVEDNDGRRRTLSARVEEVKRDSEASDDFRLTRSYKAELDRLAKRLEKVDFNQKKAKAELERLEGLYRQAASIKTQLEAKEAELVEAFKKSAGALREDLTRLVARRETLQQADIALRYEGYLEKERRQVEAFRRSEDMLLPQGFDYMTLDTLRIEARQKLTAQQPRSLGEASRISGVSPGDIAVLMVWLEKRSREQRPD